MLRKYTTPKKIIFVTLVTSLTGLISEWIVARYDHTLSLSVLKGILTTLDFSWFVNGHFNFTDVNYVNLFFYLLLLTGGILYWISNQKESRLIRFVFSIILINRVISCIYPIVYFLISFKSNADGIVSNLFLGSFYLICQAGWIWLSYRVLKYFRSVKLLDTIASEYGDVIEISFSYASVWQRFFHPVMDNIVSLLIFSTVTDVIIQLQHVSAAFGSPESVGISRAHIYYGLILFRGLYYIFFESVVGATPAKLLSETRVVTLNGERPRIASITGRTFARLLPFEWFSFLKGGSGWHDAVSDTMVVKEKRAA